MSDTSSIFDTDILEPRGLSDIADGIDTAQALRADARTRLSTARHAFANVVASGASEAKGKPTWLYVMTDHDPSGLGIASHMERIIRGFLPDGYPVTVTRLAVTPEQIAQWRLPTRPTKRTDSRSKGFAGESVELDAIPPATLRRIVREAIERHIDRDVLERTQRTEALERETLFAIRAHWGDSA